MERAQRKVIGYNDYLQEFREWNSVYACAKDLRISMASVSNSMDKGWVCQGWILFDDEKVMEEKIAKIQTQIVRLNELRKHFKP